MNLTEGSINYRLVSRFSVYSLLLGKVWGPESCPGQARPRSVQSMVSVGPGQAGGGAGGVAVSAVVVR